MITEVQAVDTVVPVRFAQRLFSFPMLLTGLLALLAVLTVRGRFDDPDMWWNLRMGQIIWTSHTIPHTDTFSYTARGHAYVPHEWLAQLSIFSAFQVGGYSGLMLWLCVFSATILIVGYLLCWTYSGNAKVAFAGAMVLWLFATIGFAIRSQMIGYLLLIFELLCLQLGRTRSPRWFLALPLLFVVWVNVHGSFIFGLAIASVLLFSSLFSFRMGLLVSQRWDKYRQRVLAIAIAVSIAALFLNPTGIKQVRYPIDTMLHQPMAHSQVEEWKSLGFHDPRAYALLLCLLCPFVVALIRQRDVFWEEVLLLTLATSLAVKHDRMLFVFGIMIAPVLSRILASEWDNYDIKHDRPLANAVLLAVTLCGIFLAFPSRQTLEQQVKSQSPVKAVEFLKKSDLSGRMLNEYAFGGYLLWAAPEYPVFIDGRGELFEEIGVFGELGDWTQLRSDPKELLNKYQIDFCLLARQSPMARVLSLMQWRIVYSDENSVIFRRSETVSKVDHRWKSAIWN